MKKGILTRLFFILTVKVFFGLLETIFVQSNSIDIERLIYMVSRLASYINIMSSNLKGSCQRKNYHECIYSNI